MKDKIYKDKYGNEFGSIKLLKSPFLNKQIEDRNKLILFKDQNNKSLYSSIKHIIISNAFSFRTKKRFNELGIYLKGEDKYLVKLFFFYSTFQSKIKRIKCNFCNFRKNHYYSICFTKVNSLYSLLTKQSSDMYKNLLSKLNHETRNSCNCINDLILNIQKEVAENFLSLKHSNTLTSLLETISYSSDTIINSINQISDFTNGLNALTLVFSEISLNELGLWAYNTLKSNLTLTGKIDQIKITYEINNELKGILIKTDMNKLKSILMESIKNSINYTSKGYIAIVIDYFSYNKQKSFTVYPLNTKTQNIDNITIMIKDSGIGFSKIRMKDINDHLEKSEVNQLLSFHKFGLLRLGLLFISAYSSKLNVKYNLFSKEREGTLTCIDCNDITFNKSKKLKTTSDRNLRDSPIRIQNSITITNKSLNNSTNFTYSTKSLIQKELDKNKLKFKSASSNFKHLIEATENEDKLLDLLSSYCSDMDELRDEENFNERINKSIRSNKKIKQENVSNTTKSTKLLSYKHIDKDLPEKKFSERQLLNSVVQRKESNFSSILKNSKPNSHIIKEIHSSEDEDASVKENTKESLQCILSNKSDFDLIYEIKNHSLNDNIILIIDDDFSVRNAIKKLVTQILQKYDRLNKFTILTLSDGIDLIKYCIYAFENKLSIKLILTDENMKYLNGSTALNFLKDINTKIPFFNFCSVIVTALNDKEVINELKKKTNCDIILNKPINISLLEETLKKVKIIF